jgi:kinesin family protein 6/9
MGDSEGSEGIRVFARIRPARQKKTIAHQNYNIDTSDNSIMFEIPKDAAGGYVNNAREMFKFKFNTIFEDKCTQEVLFNSVGRDIINSCLEGINGTIFAYGQTGSGKTFTITGGATRYEDRGLIPRTLAYIFSETEKRPTMHFDVSISYLEIYNNCGYDLLDPNHDTKNLEDLPKVSIMSDEQGNVSMSNLKDTTVTNVEDALNLLFVGDTNRVICETPSNDSSTRSHCIFSINLSSRDIGGSKIKKSKLNLVDLAGSERIKKTQVDGKIRNEAIHINMSLHFLEAVIVALQQRAQACMHTYGPTDLHRGNFFKIAN